jgi:hypothetical protein
MGNLDHCPVHSRVCVCVCVCMYVCMYVCVCVPLCSASTFLKSNRDDLEDYMLVEVHTAQRDN